MTPLLLLACTSADPHAGGLPGADDDPPATEVPQLTPIPTYDCPDPPDDAITFTAGTHQADWIFYRDPDGRRGFHVISTGLSYRHDRACEDILPDMQILHDVKDGKQPGEYTFQLVATLPGTQVEHWLGEFPMNDGHIWSHIPAHLLKLGWNDGDGYQWVFSMPNGWTQSTLCVEAVSPDYLKLTMLWDPLDGPFTTNHHTQVHQPIFFELHAGGYQAGSLDEPRWSCHSSGFAGFEQDEIFGAYDWPGSADGPGDVDWPGLE